MPILSSMNTHRLVLTAVLVLSSGINNVLAVPYSAAGFPGKIIKTRDDLLSTYDYVVVGGGTSGMVISSRLSENPKVTVLVIEAGDFADDSERFMVPGNLFFAGIAPENMWPLSGAPMSELQNRTLFPNSARIVGGGTAINGMLFDRGAPGDYDIWGELIGDTKNWSWKGLLPYFKKSEKFTPPSKEMQKKWGITYDMDVHGTKGPIQNSYPPWIYDHHRDLIKASKEVGIPVPKDGNGNAIGAFWVPNSIDPIRRERSYARNYYKLASTRPNYHIITKHLVTRLTSDSKGTITGVEFVPYTDPTATTIPPGILKTQIRAKKEVIMAAGAVHTPRILQLSGIGPKKYLEDIGISVINDLPGVGENFQDHPGAFSVWNVTYASKEMDPSYIYTNQTYGAEAYQEYLTHRTGPYTVSSGSALVFLTAQHLNLPSQVLKQTELENPAKYLLSDTHPSVIKGFGKVKNLMVKHFRKGSMAVQETTSGGSGIGGGIAHPFSRGRIRISSADPFTLPVVDWRPFTHPADISILVAGLKWQNNILANAPTNLAKNVVPVTPPREATEEQLIEWLRSNAVPSWAHLSGSCAMLKKEDGGVVDGSLRVYGSKGRVRIVDASLMPVVPGTHTQSTVYAVAEKAADIIKKDDGRY